MQKTFNLVFSNYRYSFLAAIIFVVLLIPLLIISEFIFYEPYWVFHIPPDGWLGFSLIVIVSILAGIVLSMNVFRIKNLRNKPKKISGGIFGSILGSLAGACSCGPIGFAVISTFGSIGGVATAFLTTYEIPLRLVAIGILGYTLYTTNKSLAVECKINPQES